MTFAGCDAAIVSSYQMPPAGRYLKILAAAVLQCCIQYSCTAHQAGPSRTSLTNG